LLYKKKRNDLLVRFISSAVKISSKRINKRSAFVANASIVACAFV
jgi:hypothetical protein